MKPPTGKACHFYGKRRQGKDFSLNLAQMPTDKQREPERQSKKIDQMSKGIYRGFQCKDVT